MFADVEQIVVDWLAANVFAGGGDRVLVAIGGQQQQRKRTVAHAARLVTVERIGSSPGDTQPTLDVADVQLDFFARNRDRAKALAFAAHVAMRYQFETFTHETGAFITQVRTVGAPAQTPWEAEAVARFTATYRVWVHHAPL